MDHELLAQIRYSLCYVQGIYNNMKFKIMIDSGAELSVISSSVIHILGLQHKINKNYAGKAHGVGTSNILGKIIGLEIKIQDMIIKNNYGVLESPEKMILLGMDFLTHHDCNISIRNKCINIDGVEVKFLNEMEIDELHSPILNKLTTPLIDKIINNIVNNPKEDKFRKVNRKMLNEEEEQYLLHIGFMEANEKLVFCDNVALLNDALVC